MIFFLIKYKIEFPGVEKLSTQLEIFLCKYIFLFISVSLVSYNRMSYTSHMYTDLMCSASFERDL